MRLRSRVSPEMRPVTHRVAQAVCASHEIARPRAREEEESEQAGAIAVVCVATEGVAGATPSALREKAPVVGGAIDRDLAENLRLIASKDEVARVRPPVSNPGNVDDLGDHDVSAVKAGERRSLVPRLACMHLSEAAGASPDNVAGDGTRPSTVNIAVTLMEYAAESCACCGGGRCMTRRCNGDDADRQGERECQSRRSHSSVP